MNDLIYSDELSTEFLKFFGKASASTQSGVCASVRTGSLRVNDLSEKLQRFIRVRSKNSALIGDGFVDLFDGDTEHLGGDHSKADFALIKIFADAEFSPEESDQALRASGLYREKWDSKRGDTTYGWQTIDRVYATLDHNKVVDEPKVSDWCIEDFVPRYIPGGMPAREFAGPKIATGAHLFPKNALSAMVAIGGGGKTSAIISLGAHIAGGRHWKGCPTKATKVIVFAVEETQEELNRKFSAIVDQWAAPDRERAIANLRLASLHGVDARLIQRDYGETTATVWPNNIANLALEFGIDGDGLIFLDHYQGFATGDLNVSDTATAICREGNRIVANTGASVVLTAHIPKAHIGNNQISQGMASGSLAFENAMRQVVVLVPMSDDEAKKYDIADDQNQYLRLGFTKNSYGTTDAECWLRKIHVPAYHTIRIEPVDLVVPISQPRRSSNDKLSDAIMLFIKGKPYVTKNMLDAASGVDGPLSASKEKCRSVLNGLIDSGAIYSHSLTDEERSQLGAQKQVKEVLRVA